MHSNRSAFFYFSKIKVQRSFSSSGITSTAKTTFIPSVFEVEIIHS